MKNFTYYIVFLVANIILGTGVQSQEFEIREFVQDPSDLSARRYEKRTVNDEPAALIKITTNIRGMQFDSNVGIVDVEHKEDGYWVYVVPRERRIRIMATDYIAQDIPLPEPARSFTVYQLVIASKGGVASSDLVRITFRLNQNNVYIRSGQGAPILSSTSNAVFNVPRGEHTFRFIKQGFAEKELTLNLTEEQVIDITLETGQATTSFALSGMVLVTSEPSGAEVFLNDQRVGVTPYQGSQIAGSYTLFLRHPSYHDHFEQFELGEGETNTLTNIELKPNYGYWQLTTRPSGAEVHLNGRLIGTTPLSRGQISSGQHELMIRKSLYHQHTESFFIDDGDEKRLDIALKPAFGKLVITSEPNGATVYINDRPAGTTPYSNPQHPSGDYSITLKKDLYADVHDNIKIIDNETTERFLALSMNFGTLEIQTSDAKIFINGQEVGKGNLTQNLAPGNYRIKATKESHTADEKEVFIMLGQTERISLSPQPRMGSVRILSEPFETVGSNIFVNGMRQSQTTPAVIPLLFGDYEITVKKDGFVDNSKVISVIEGQEQELNFSMNTFRKLIVHTNVRRAEIILNENRTLRNGSPESIEVGSHTLSVQAEGFDKQILTLNVRPNDKDLKEIFVQLLPKKYEVEIKLYSVLDESEDKRLEINNVLKGSLPEKVDLNKGIHRITVSSATNVTNYFIKVKSGTKEIKLPEYHQIEASLFDISLRHLDIARLSLYGLSVSLLNFQMIGPSYDLRYYVPEGNNMTTGILKTEFIIGGGLNRLIDIGAFAGFNYSSFGDGAITKEGSSLAKGFIYSYGLNLRFRLQTYGIPLPIFMRYGLITNTIDYPGYMYMGKSQPRNLPFFDVGISLAMGDNMLRLWPTLVR